MKKRGDKRGKSERKKSFLTSETARKVSRDFLFSSKSKIPTPYSSSRDTSASIRAESSSAKLSGQARFPFKSECGVISVTIFLHFVRPVSLLVRPEAKPCALLEE